MRRNEMNNIDLPYFGKLNKQSLQDEYDVEIEFKDRKIDIFLNEMLVMKQENIEIIKSKLSDLFKTDDHVRAYISEEFESHENGSVTFDYLSFYLESWEEYDLEEVINLDDTELNNLKKIKNLLRLENISIYSDLMVFDYFINSEISDQILAVKVDYKDKYCISWES